MTVRYGLLGATSVLEAQIRQLIEQIGYPVGVWQDLFTELDTIRQAGPHLVMVNGLRNFEEALEVSRYLSANLEAEIIMLGDGQSPQKLKAAMRVGCKDLIHPYRDADRLVELVNHMVGTVGPSTVAAGGEVIAVVGSRGGIGVTTASLALAWLLSEEQANAVVLVDMDQAHGDILGAINVRAGYTTQDLLNSRGSLDVAKIRGAIGRQKAGPWVLPQPEEDMDSTTVTDREAGPLLEILRRAFTHVVVDMGVSMGIAGRAVCQNADKVVLIVDHEVVSMRTAVRRLRILKGLGLEKNQIFVVLNRFQPKRKPDWETIEKQIGHPLCATVVQDYDTVREALDKGQSVLEVAARSEVAQDLRYVKAQLMGEKIEPKSRGWWLSR